jgi:hypothetical protein
MGVFAEFERAMIQELKHEGLGASKIAKRLQIGRASVYRVRESTFYGLMSASTAADMPLRCGSPPPYAFSRESKPDADYRLAILLYSAIARFKSSYSSQGMTQIRSRASRCSSALAGSPCTRCASPRCSCALRCRGLRISACR